MARGLFSRLHDLVHRGERERFEAAARDAFLAATPDSPRDAQRRPAATGAVAPAGADPLPPARPSRAGAAILPGTVTVVGTASVQGGIERVAPNRPGPSRPPSPVGPGNGRSSDAETHTIAEVTPGSGVGSTSASGSTVPAEPSTAEPAKPAEPATNERVVAAAADGREPVAASDRRDLGHRDIAPIDDASSANGHEPEEAPVILLGGPAPTPVAPVAPRRKSVPKPAAKAPGPDAAGSRPQASPPPSAPAADRKEPAPSRRGSNAKASNPKASSAKPANAKASNAKAAAGPVSMPAPAVPMPAPVASASASASGDARRPAAGKSASPTGKAPRTASQEPAPRSA